MKKQTIQKIVAVLVPTALFLGVMAPAFADNLTATAGVTTSVAGTSVTAGTSTTATTKADKQAATEAKITSKSEAAVQARVADLNAILARINAMVNVSATVKASIAASIQTTITNLNTLEAKLATDTTPATMAADAKSVIDTTRVYMLVLPQARILAAADRAQTISQMITALSVKLQTPIAAAQAAGKDMTAITAAQADISAKVADANVQASAAISAVSGLVPDNGVAATATANTAAIKGARGDLLAAEKDLKAAQADSKSIIAALKSFNLSASTSTSTTTSAGAQ
jgi:hypothetical protein